MHDHVLGANSRLPIGELEHLDDITHARYCLGELWKTLAPRGCPQTSGASSPTSCARSVATRLHPLGSPVRVLHQKARRLSGRDRVRRRVEHRHPVSANAVDERLPRAGAGDVERRALPRCAREARAAGAWLCPGRVKDEPDASCSQRVGESRRWRRSGSAWRGASPLIELSPARAVSMVPGSRKRGPPK